MSFNVLYLINHIFVMIISKNYIMGYENRVIKLEKTDTCIPI